MSNGHPPPVCDPVCQKILLNGESLESAATDTCNMLKRLQDGRNEYANPMRVVEALIAAERATFYVQRVAMEEIGYHASWPDHLS